MKYTTLIFLLVSNFIFSQQYLKSKIDENLLNSVVKLNTSKRILKDSILRENATGFIVKNNDNFYLITNKHVIGKFDFISNFIPKDTLRISFYKKTKNSFKEYTIILKDLKNKLNPLIKIHNQNIIDIVSIEITDIFKKDTSLYKGFIEFDKLQTLEKLKESETIGLGSTIFTLGYPKGLSLSNSNKPIAKFAFISTLLTGDLELLIQNELKKTVNLNCKFFLVDGLITNGNSGGPVLSQKDFYFNINEKNQFKGVKVINSNSILGIVSTGLIGTNQTIIYPSDYIIDLIQ